MRVPESLQDLAYSETVRFLRKPKSVTRILAGVRPLGHRETGDIRSQLHWRAGQEGVWWGKEAKGD
jgi:hypothetical protein